MVEEHDSHRWIENTKNDVGIRCEKAGDIWLIYCECGRILKEREDPTGKVILCDINEEEYKIELGGLYGV